LSDRSLSKQRTKSSPKLSLENKASTKTISTLLIVAIIVATFATETKLLKVTYTNICRHIWQREATIYTIHSPTEDDTTFLSKTLDLPTSNDNDNGNDNGNDNDNDNININDDAPPSPPNSLQSDISSLALLISRFNRVSTSIALANPSHQLQDFASSKAGGTISGTDPVTESFHFSIFNFIRSVRRTFTHPSSTLISSLLYSSSPPFCLPSGGTLVLTFRWTVNISALTITYPLSPTSHPPPTVLAVKVNGSKRKPEVLKIYDAARRSAKARTHLLKWGGEEGQDGLEITFTEEVCLLKVQAFGRPTK
jgi:hypothetical protein